MAEIYSRSYLTIAASRAENSQHGFLFDFPEDTVHYSVLTDAPEATEGSEYCNFHASFQIDHRRSKEESTPLDGRAWCLQEWYLPKRLVEFCLHDIRLMCLRSVETRFGRTNDEHTRTRTIVRAFGVRREDAFRTFWENIRQDLFGREITKTLDKLPAMAGLAQLLEKMLIGVPNHRYLAGLWSTRICEDLSWTVLHQYDRETKSIPNVPTWSWASTTCQNDYIYGRPSETFADLIHTNCTGYAYPRESLASLTFKGFTQTLFLRVDHLHDGYDGRPHLSFWLNPKRAQITSIEAIEAKVDKDRERGVRTGHVFVSDMPFSPTPHEHSAAIDAPAFTQVPSITRATPDTEDCTICAWTGYVVPVTLLLLTKTDVSYTALVLAAVPGTTATGKEGEGVVAEGDLYHRLGLLEMDCIPGRSQGNMATADGLRVPVRRFWRVGEERAKKIIRIV